MGLFKFAGVVLTLASCLVPSVSAAPTSSVDPCSCKGAVVNNVCQDSLARAIGVVPAGGIVTVGGKKVITSPIQFNKNIKLRGVSCSGKKATLSAKMSTTEGGMLEVRGPGRVQVELENILFTRESGSGPAAAFRGGVVIPEGKSASDYSDKDAPVVDLSVTNCDFVGLSTKARGGSALYIMKTGSVNICSKSTFKDNIVEKNGDRFGGGGAVWLVEVSNSSKVNINGVYRGNVGKFEHSLGGAVMFNRIRGNVNIRGEYRNNKASDGGALHVERVEPEGCLDINGVFDSNEAVEYGWGSRAGAVRIQYVRGTVVQDGTYTNNKSGGRGGVSATNRMYQGGQYTLRGKYLNNVADATGGVFDMLGSYDFEPTAKFIVDGSCIFQGNKSKLRANTDILSISPLGARLDESQWKGQTIVYERK